MRKIGQDKLNFKVTFPDPNFEKRQERLRRKSDKKRKIDVSSSTFIALKKVKEETEKAYGVSLSMDDFISWMTDTQHEQNERHS